MTTQRRVLTTADLESEFGIPVETWRYWRWRGEGPKAARVGRRVYYDRDDVEAWWEARKAGAAA